MKQTTTTKIGRLLVVCLWMLMSYSSYAQNPTYELYVTNQSQVDSKTYQFDVYLLRTGTTDLVLYGVQFGLGIDTSIANGGSLSCSYVSGTTQLSSTQAAFTNQFVTTYFNVGGVVYRYFNQSAVAASTTSAATTISGVKNGCSSPGTRIGTYRLTNSVNFKPASTCKHFFSGLTAASGRTATKVSAWVNGVVVDISAGTTNGASNINYAYNTTGTCDQNLSLNGCAVLASVSSQTAVTCFGGSNGSATITLSGNGTSSTGTYTVDGGSSVSYTSNPFTVSGLSAGPHSISVSSGICSASTGSFTINGPSAAITSSFSASGCVSYTLPWGGSVTSSGAYNHTYTSAAGCDSIVTANVTIIPQPSQPTLACYQTATFNTTTCEWDVTGTQPAAPTGLACYQTATFNTTTCEWDVTGTQPAAPTGLACYQTATFNNTTCEWDVTGSQPQQPTIACYQTATFNNTTCEWDVTGSPIVSSFSDAGCGSYALPWGTTVSTSGSYNHVYTSALGCDSTVTANITINEATSSVTNYAACGSTLPYYWNGVAYNVAGSYTATLTNAAGCDSTAVLNLTISGVTPAAPTVVTQTLVSNNCGERIYRYAVTAVTGAAGYAWILPTSIGGVASGATIDSGDIASSRVIRVMYSSNAAAGSDSIKVRAYSGCGSSANKAFKLSNTAWAPLAAPAITATNLITNVCGERRIRYSVPVAATTAGLVGYEWSFVGDVLGANAFIDSGASDSRVIVVLYSSNAAAVANDSVKFRFNYNDGCTYGAYAKSKISLTALTAPLAPTITATTVISNVCGQRRIRYSVPTTPAATATAGAATGYEWSFVGTGLMPSAFIDSGASDSRVIVVLYPSNAAAAASDSVRCRYTSDCGFGGYGRSKNALAALNAPLAPTAITATTVVSNVCGGRRVRYSVPTTPAATTTAGAATGYEWSFVGTGLMPSAFIDSGSTSSRVIVVTYPSNSAAASSDSVRCRYTSDCGFGAYVRYKNPLAALTAPLAPTAITITAVAPSVCGAKVYRYAAPATLPVATATAGAATGWLWSFTGTLGANASIDSGNVNSQVILVSFTSNAAAGIGDSVRLAYLSGGCGTSANKSSKLTNVVTAVPAAPTAITATALQTNVCGARRYRYAAPATVPVASATLAAPTGWFWSFTGTLGANAVIDSGNVNSKVITVTFTSNAAAATGDSVKLQYTSSCGNSLPAKLKLTNTALVTPAPATAPTIQVVSDICGDRRYRYTAPAVLPAATATTPAATGWLWSFTGTLGANAVIDSGDATSQKIVVRFTVYTAAATGDSVRVAFTSGCGTSANKSTKLSNLAKTCTTPANIPVTKAPVVNTPAEAMSVKVFPNPSTTNFNVQVITAGKEEITARVLDVQGRFIKSVKVAAGKTMNIGSELKPGAYFIEVRQGREVKTTRVLKF